MTIIEFLLARIDEDEAQASSGWSRYPDSRWTRTNEGQSMLSPEAVLADSEAKRRIVERAAKVESLPGIGTSIDGRATLVAHDRVLEDMASVYASHPDYQKEWAA